MKPNLRRLRFSFLPLSLMALVTLTAAPALAWDVTFTRDKAGANSAESFNLTIVMEQQTNAPTTSLETMANCRIPWDDPDDSCTIAGFPSSTNTLVTVYQTTTPDGMQRDSIGKIRFWVGVFEDSEIHIPTGVASFKADKTLAELETDDCCTIAILPQGNVEMGETISDRPNSGTAYFGQKVGDCGPQELASDQQTECAIDFLSGCYAPVFARGASASGGETEPEPEPQPPYWSHKKPSGFGGHHHKRHVLKKIKKILHFPWHRKKPEEPEPPPDSGPPSQDLIWVNIAEASAGSDHVLCIKNDLIVDYQISVQDAP